MRYATLAPLGPEVFELQSAALFNVDISDLPDVLNGKKVEERDLETQIFLMALQHGSKPDITTWEQAGDSFY
jgi:hypothetical protein